MSIRLRLAVFFTLAALLLLVGVGALYLRGLKAELDQSLTLTLRARSDNVAIQLAALPPPVTESRLREHRFQRILNGAFAQVLSPQGRVIDSSRLISDEPLLSARQATEARRRVIVLNESVVMSAPPDTGAESMRVLARRIRPSGDVLVVAISRDVADTAVSSSRNQFILLGIALLALAGAGAWLLTRAALRPVERMRVQVENLPARDVGSGLQVPKTRDEIARLADTFNDLLARMHGALTREQALVADAGHELRTPLTVLKGELELARRPHRSVDQLRATVEIAAEETERLVRLTDDLLFLSSEDVDGQRGFPVEDFDLAAVVRQTARAMQARFRARDVELRTEVSEPIVCRGRPEWIRRAIDNLLANASRHAPQGSTVTLRASKTATEACVAVTDEGPGFPADFLPVAFHRFTRADDSRVRAPIGDVDTAGAGLGLAIVASIVARHGGSATAANRPTGGAEVTFRLPLGAEAHPASPA